MSLVTEYDNRTGSVTNQNLLRVKAEQAAINEALDIQADAAASAGRKAFAAEIIADPQKAVYKLMPRLVRKTQIANNGGEANDTIIITEVKAAIALIAP